MPLLDLRGLSLRFGGLSAVQGLDLSVEPGRIFSVIGPNGAGKTTVFNGVTGVYEPSEGSAAFDGKDLRRPFRGTTLAAAAGAGLATGLLLALFSLNVDRLWKVAVKDCLAERKVPAPAGVEVRRDLDLPKAAAALRGYLRADLRVDERWAGRFVVVPRAGKPFLSGILTDAQAAREARDRIQEAVLLAAAGAKAVPRGRGWALLSADGTQELLRFDSQEQAERRVLLLAETARGQAFDRAAPPIAFGGGFALGVLGWIAVWRRTRRAPDRIAREGIARTFQNIRLFRDLDVVENVLLGMDARLRGRWWQSVLRTPAFRREEREAREKALEILRFVGLEARAGNRARNLPYAAQRRLEIARALASRPRLLLLDEPAAGMNPAEAKELMALIRRIRELGITVLLIEHHMDVVMGISDRVAVLDHGVKIAEGPPEEVRNDPKVIEAYLGVMANDE